MNVEVRGLGGVWPLFNPFSQEFKEAEEVFHKLEGWRQVAVVIASIVGGLFFIVGAFPVFCWTVNAIQPNQDDLVKPSAKFVEEVDRRFNTDKPGSVERKDHSTGTFNPVVSNSVASLLTPTTPQATTPPQKSSGFLNFFSKAIRSEKPQTQPCPPTAHQIQESQAFLNKLSENYKNIFKNERYKRILWGHALVVIKYMSRTSGAKPDDHPLSNPILDCQGDDEALFIPTNVLKCKWVGLNKEAFTPNKTEHLEFFKEALQAAFIVGKKIVVTRFANHDHCVAAAFSSDGQFKIIDSMGGTAVNIKSLEKKLNQSGMVNANGEQIRFKGEYINTYVQKGGFECIRFATLYCYQIFKRKNLNAFEEVNGAFAEGKLKRYEDYKTMDGSKKIRSLSKYNNSLYKRFMTSWYYRTQGIENDSWQEIPLQTFKRQTFCYGQFGVYFLQKKEKDPPELMEAISLVFEDTKGKIINAQDFATMPREQEIFLSEDVLANGTLGSLASPNESRLLIFEKDNSNPRLYRILPGHKVHVILRPEETIICSDEGCVHS